MKINYRPILVFTLLVIMVWGLSACDMNNDDTVTIQEELIEVESKPEEGFHWNYYIYIPKTFDRNDEADYTDHILVIPNYPEISDDPEAIKDGAKTTIKINKNWTKELRVPILVPAYPRPETIEGTSISPYHHDTHRLDRNTLSLHLHDGVKEKYHRIDKQVAEMIDHAVDVFEKNNVYFSDQVFMFGFSATGNFSNRFTKIHPEKVQASASGGVGIISLPEHHRNEVNLNYPAGVYDLDELTNTHFDVNAFQDAPQFIFQGTEEQGFDPLASSNAINETEAEKYKKAVGTIAVDEDLSYTEEAKQIYIDRFNKVKEIYNENNAPSQFKLYKGVGHEMTSEIWDDVIEFFRNNADNELDEI